MTRAKPVRGFLAVVILAIAWFMLPTLSTLFLAVAGVAWYVRATFGLGGKQ